MANPNSRNQVRNEISFASNQQNIKFCLSILCTRAWTPSCLQKWPRHPPTHRETSGFTLPSCWNDWKIPLTLAASNENWIRSQTFPPQNWSVFLEAVRPDSDLEGWHNGLNRRAKGLSQLPLYIFIHLLHREATLVKCRSVLFQTRSKETPAVNLQNHAEKTLRPLEAV